MRRRLATLRLAVAAAALILAPLGGSGCATILMSEAVLAGHENPQWIVAVEEVVLGGRGPDGAPVLAAARVTLADGASWDYIVGADLAFESQAQGLLDRVQPDVAGARPAVALVKHHPGSPVNIWHLRAIDGTARGEARRAHRGLGAQRERGSHAPGPRPASRRLGPAGALPHRRSNPTVR